MQASECNHNFVHYTQINMLFSYFIKTNSTFPQTNLQLSRLSGDSFKAQALASLMFDAIPNATTIVKGISCSSKEKSCQLLLETNKLNFNAQNIAHILIDCPKLIYNQNRNGSLFIFAYVNKVQPPILICIARFDAQLNHTVFGFKMQGHGIVQNIILKEI